METVKLGPKKGQRGLKWFLKGEVRGLEALFPLVQKIIKSNFWLKECCVSKFEVGSTDRRHRHVFFFLNAHFIV